MGIHASEMDYLQADNEMRTFAAMTGGRAYFPRFQAEYGEDFQDIGDDIRHQYSLSYHPTNSKLDGTYRKLKVEVLAPDGAPLKVKDQKGKDQKIDVVSRDGYTANYGGLRGGSSGELTDREGHEFTRADRGSLASAYPVAKRRLFISPARK